MLLWHCDSSKCLINYCYSVWAEYRVIASDVWKHVSVIRNAYCIPDLPSSEKKTIANQLCNFVDENTMSHYLSYVLFISTSSMTACSLIFKSNFFIQMKQQMRGSPIILGTTLHNRVTVLRQTFGADLVFWRHILWPRPGLTTSHGFRQMLYACEKGRWTPRVSLHH